MTLSEILAAVRRVEVRTNRLVNDMMVGAYLSRFKGRGMDFEELREYMPGDDIRDIDWNVTNRMGRPFVKRYREERELSAAIELRRRFPGITDNEKARQCARSIAGWTPPPVPAATVTPLRPRKGRL